MNRLWLFLVAAVFAGYWLFSQPSAAGAGDPLDWSEEPYQEETDEEAFEVETRKGTVTLTPRAEFDVSAVVAGAERYRLDRESFLSPVDLVLTWGELPEEPYKSQVSYDQSARFYFWRVPTRELDLRYIQAHSSNMHMIPATSNLKRALTSVGEGDSVRVRGLLVNAAREDGYTWNSSRSRKDSGPGACELIWVEELQVGRKVYR
ncbi:MAG TPA: hypothetical protein VL025_12230, partial [Thermoanaerobaculia bacterium]|nr:hypothetical protein [Thermoanaerobaculia bacterium]